MRRLVHWGWSANPATAETSRLMDYPLSPFVDYEVHPLVELDAAFDRFIPFVERMSERMAAAS